MRMRKKMTTLTWRRMTTKKSHLSPRQKLGRKMKQVSLSHFKKNIGFYATVYLKILFSPGVSLVSKVLANFYVIHCIDLNMLLLSLDLDRVIRPNPWNALV